MELEHLDDVRLSEFDPLKYGEGVFFRVDCDDFLGDFEVQVYRMEDDSNGE